MKLLRTMADLMPYNKYVLMRGPEVVEMRISGSAKIGIDPLEDHYQLAGFYEGRGLPMVGAGFIIPRGGLVIINGLSGNYPTTHTSVFNQSASNFVLADKAGIGEVKKYVEKLLGRDVTVF